MAIRKVGKYFQIDYYDPNGRRIRKNFKKKKEAVAELAKRESLKAENRYLDVKKEYKTTLGQIIDIYTLNFQYQVTFEAHKKRYLDNFKSYFGEDTLLTDIRYVDLESYQSHLKQKLTKGGTLRKPATINRERNCLHQIFSKAVEWEMIDQSPFDRGKSLALKENNERTRFLNEDEIDRILDACRDHLYPVVLCALTTGMRRGEILGLKWKQVRNGFIYLRKTKTFNARQIPISDELAELFKSIRQREHLRSEYVFTYAGRRMKANDHGFKAALRQAEIEDFHFHDLRHTFASQVLLRGGSLKDIQELLGHKDIKSTMRYAHLTQESKIKAVNLLNGISKKSNSHKIVTKLKSVSVTD
jgi:integrase